MNRKASTAESKKASGTRTKRSYNSPLRQQRTAETRESIIAAGAGLVHSYTAWDWTNLTADAVGQRAGISARTVHRYFPTERKLRDAVLQRLLEESGVDLENLEIDQFAGVTARMFDYLSTFTVAPATVDDPSFASMDSHRREALFNAAGRATETSGPRRSA